MRYCLLLISTFLTCARAVYRDHCVDNSVVNKSVCCIMDTLKNAAKDTAYVHRALFDYDTLMIFGSAVPLYALGLALDEPIHRVFYDKHTHTNAHQLNDHTIKNILHLTKVGIWGYTLGGLLWYESRHKAQLFLIGHASALFIKTLIKGFEWWPAQRPYNQRFEKKHIYTGFPSGQMTQVTYLMTTLGLEYGKLVGVGLGILAGVIAGVLVSSNRHYISQVVAGSALGISYGLAVHKTMHAEGSTPWACGLTSDTRRPSGYIAYRF